MTIFFGFILSPFSSPANSTHLRSLHKDGGSDDLYTDSEWVLAHAAAHISPLCAC